MKYSFAGIAFVACIGLFGSSVQLFGADVKPLKRAELQQMIRDAHTEKQYQALAQYFRTQQNGFEQQAKQERVEWISLSQNGSWPGVKAPTPADFAKNWYEQLSSNAEKMGEKAEHFEDLAAKGAQ